MIIKDLEHIFKSQLDKILDSDVNNIRLYFMLVDGEHNMIERHDSNDLEGLIPILDCFQYAGTVGGMPRFIK